MTTPIPFIYRIDRLDANGEILEHLAGIENRDLAMAAYEAACTLWPGAPITLREGAQVVKDSRKTRLA